MGGIIRLAKVGEAEALTDLSLRSKRSNGYDHAFMEACRDELTVRPEDLADGTYWVIEDEDLAACACLQIDRASGSGEVHSFFVDPDRKGQGIGKALWAHLVREARQHDLNGLVLDADPHAVGFYQAMGCVEAGLTPSGSIPGRMLPRMHLDLGAHVLE
ncbi:GNAT family N-acetyltransferase [Thalassococcus sp. S3]|uniref:GNAT family N-acetyltransferase n=1 Tax=Thalassococcus sp. S3 TaxID=2017482 RepID=UPI0013EE4E66|nr:GNAT family N-acetyltransferase [Thalassococcus sp. S3]